MRYRQPLDEILESPGKLRALRFLCRKGGEWTGRGLASELDMNPVTAHRALRELYRAGILKFHPAGGSYLYSLREDHYLVREILKPLFLKEVAARERLADLLRQVFKSKAGKEVVAAAFFGSVAREQEKPLSDIDLLILVQSEKAKKEVEDSLAPVSETILREFGNALAPYVNTVREAQAKYRSGLPLFQNILRDQKPIWGEPIREMFNDQAA